MTLLATGMIAMGLASCSGRGSDNVSSSDDGDAIFNKFDGDIEQNVTLHILENDTAKSLGYLDELLNDFNAAYADKGIKAVDANIDQYTDLAQDGPAGYGPDLIYQANDMIMKNVAGHHILPLPIKKIEEESELPEEAAKAFRGTVNGKTYTFGAPVNIQAPFLFYRKDMLPEDCDKNGNGVPDMIESWNNLYSYSQAIKAQGGTKRGYMKALYDVYFSGGFVFSYGGYVFGNNGTDPNDIGFNKGESYKGAREIRQLASVMDKTCSDTSINTTCYSKIAQGEFFATMTTPDVKNNFINEMANQYETAEGLSKDAALQKAKEPRDRRLAETAVLRRPDRG
jgi:arabinogalactan oligomer/maltooligosaccharide transport system substrate-binding protein